MHRILVVDDDAAVAESMRARLEISGYAAVALPSADAALDYLARGRAGVSAILTDFHMSGMDGATFARRVAESYPGIPVILCSGSGGDGLEPSSLRQGIAAILYKPVRRQELLDTLSRMIAQTASREN